LTFLVEEIPVHEFDGDVEGLSALPELEAHREYAVYEGGSLVRINLGHTVLLEVEVREVNVVVKLVASLVLEHLGKQLRGGNVGIELQLGRLDGRALVL
jgi:hypothetical protein